MFKVREDEPSYALLPDVKAPDVNQYGNKISLVDEKDPLANKPLNINGEENLANNPNRYKQHGFYFNADNCISCHACESACSEKNNLPPYLAYRSVGYVEGGSYPNYTRLNISMACNHCDNPVCLKGCPTRAYTKFAEYGAVLQDPDICFGCGYCTWVCPYNAPQLDTERGHVHKCNMCVDRLEAGLKPACASACLAGALDFGVVETTPENRDQLQTQIPGFPDTSITNPNIRFQQTKTLPRELTRPDSIPLKYERDEQGQGEFKPKVRKQKQQKQWNLSKLRSREDPLVIFTLITQAVIGVFLLITLAPLLGINAFTATTSPIGLPVMLWTLLGAETVALFLSTMHLGRPHRFYRAFNNLRYSPVSREVAGVAVFYNLLGLYTLLATFPGLLTLFGNASSTIITSTLAWTGSLAGFVALYFMHKIYRIPARPFWNHWQVLTSFYGNMLSLGGFILFVYAMLTGATDTVVSKFLSGIIFTGLAAEAIGLYFHQRAMNRQGGEGAASLYEQSTRYGKTWLLRITLLVIALAGSVILYTMGTESSVLTILGLTILGLTLLTGSLIGRALFYVLVIPTTMPGAFFWRNKGFVEHARQTGLAKMRQVGVLQHEH